MKTKYLSLLAACFLSLPALAAPGDLDPYFGTAGKVTTSLGSTDSANCVAIQGDGKIVTAGVARNAGNDDFALARYTSAGALDATFGTGGTVTTPIGSGEDSISGIAIQGDGKIVVAGSSDAGGRMDFALARYTGTGVLDATFGTGGKVTTEIGTGDSYCRGVVLQSDGSIVAVGEALVGGQSVIGLVRYTSTGALDATFGTGGKVTAAISGHAYGRSVALQSDGRIVVGGVSVSFGISHFLAVRYTSAGTLDGTFGTGGVVVASPGSSSIGRSVAIQTDGRIVLAGDFESGFGSDIALVRLASTGTLDGTFGSGGTVITGIHSDDYCYSVAIQSDGKIVAAGATRPVSAFYFALLRYTSTGALDSGFGSNGIVTTFVPTFTTDHARAYGMALQSDGKIVLAGSAYTTSVFSDSADFALARYRAGLVDEVEPTAGAFGITPAAPVLEGTVLTGHFTGWVDANPLTYEVRENRNVIAPAAADANPTFTLSPGAHSVFGRAYDSFGNYTDSAPVTYFIVSPEPTTSFVFAGATGGAAPSPGSDVPGEPAGTTFKKFGVPSVTSGGDIAFLTTMQTPEGSVAGLFNSSQIVVRKGDAAAGVAGAAFASFKEPCFYDPYTLAFHAKISGGGATGADNAGIWGTITPGNIDLIARQGDAPPGLPGVKFSKFVSLAITGTQTIFFTAKLERGIGGVDATNDTLLCSASATGGYRVLLRTGTEFPYYYPNVGFTSSVASFQTLETVSGSPGHGRCAWGRKIYVHIRSYAASLLDGIYALGDDGSIATIDIAQGGAGASHPNLASFSYSVPAANADGKVALLAKISGSTAPGIYADWLVPGVGPGVFITLPLRFMAVKGQPLDGTALGGGGTGSTPALASFKAPVFNVQRDIAWIGTIAGGGATSANNNGIWRTDLDAHWADYASGDAPSSLYHPIEVAREGSEPADVPGAQWKAFKSLAQPDYRGPLFTATMLTGASGAPGPGGVTTATDLGLWASTSDRALHLLVREGDTLTIGGTPKVVRTFTVLSAVSGSPDQRRSFDSNGNVAWRVTFLDGSQAIFATTLP